MAKGDQLSDGVNCGNCGQPTEFGPCGCPPTSVEGGGSPDVNREVEEVVARLREIDRKLSSLTRENNGNRDRNRRLDGGLFTPPKEEFPGLNGKVKELFDTARHLTVIDIERETGDLQRERESILSALDPDMRERVLALLNSKP